MGSGIKRTLLCLAAVASCGSAAAQATTELAQAPMRPDRSPALTGVDARPSKLSRAEAMFMLDYQAIPVPGEPTIDLLGFHILNPLAPGVYIGVGAYAPLVKGDYGGFMAFDVTAHVQRRISGRLFADAGVAMGGGGGGRSKEHSKLLSGTGGFVKGYLGLGYDFQDFSVGAHVARMKFKQSAIDNTFLNVFVQVPFSYTIGSFASAGEKLSVADARTIFGSASANSLTLGLHTLAQQDPKGSRKADIGLADLQFAHYMTPSTYWYASLGVGHKGLPLYNQLIGGLGYRHRITPSLSLHGQLGLGSGGYAPEAIDTGPGLLVYPKLSAEYMVTKNLGVSLSAGTLTAPRGTSRNHSVGAALTYHLQPDRGMAGAGEALDSMQFRGYRLSFFQQTAFHVRSRGQDRANVQLLSGQVDTVLSEHLYIPVQAAVAFNAYLDLPGYGEVLAGVGLQSALRSDSRFQYFGQLLGGTNVHGPMFKADIGLNYSLSDRLALRASAGRTFASSPKDVKFGADYVGVGLSYRFSAPAW